MTNFTSTQRDARPRSERRPEMIKLSKKKRKIERQLNKVNIHVEFDNPTVTAFGNFHIIETFKQAIGFNAILNNNFSLTKGVNSTYPAHQLLEHTIDACCLGLFRFEHMECLRFDPGYLGIKGISSFPSEKVIRIFLSRFEPESKPKKPNNNPPNDSNQVSTTPPSVTETNNDTKVKPQISKPDNNLTNDSNQASTTSPSATEANNDTKEKPQISKPNNNPTNDSNQVSTTPLSATNTNNDTKVKLQISKHIQELIAINTALITLKSQWTGPQSVTLDFDDTVLTVHGTQEGAEVGYNPRYHGRPSFKAKVCFIGSFNELLHLDLYGGKTHSNGDFLSFFQACIKKLPHNYVLTRLRLDKGFCDEANFNEFESRYLEYVCKAPLRERLRKNILLLPETVWEKVNAYTDVTSMDFRCSSWEKFRRVVVRRIKINENGQYYFPSPELYRYEPVVTNMTEDAKEIMDFYDDRANVENKIDELKDGFGVDQVSQHIKNRNHAFMLIKSIAYNLMNWLRQALLPENKKRCEIKTIRREIINVPGNLLGQNRFRYIKLAANRVLEAIISIVKTNLDNFLYFVANDFIPLRT